MIASKKIDAFWLMLLAVMLSVNTYAQKEKWYSYKVVNSVVYIQYQRTVSAAKQDSLLGTCGISNQQLEKLYSSGNTSDAGWAVIKLNEKEVTLSKPLKSFKGSDKDQRQLIYELAPPPPPPVPENQYYFGYNNFKKPSVIELDNGFTRFYLKVTGQPQSVYLSGTFNNWSTLNTPMRKADSGYVADVKLAPGGHLYKFIVNGHWVLDPRNKRTEFTWEGIENSVYFKTNHTFKLKGYPDAKKVYVAGSFNGWEPNIRLKKTYRGWQQKVFVREGTHAYKFVVDNHWILDPGNPTTRDDGTGNKNSFFAVGDSFYFYLPNYQQAKDVRVAGSFNVWNEAELKLFKTDSGWVLPYVLAAGNYPYKFIVDGQWVLDPNNPKTENSTGPINSLLVLKPNVSFKLKQFPNATTVRVAGDFNGWGEQGPIMYYQNKAWQIDLHFPHGKNRYKFIVDEEWVLDPNNKTYEANEYDGANSVVWIE